jgi:CheY-like chemotaxis protein
MNILLIEDDDLKLGLIDRALKTVTPAPEIVRAASYQAGVERLVKGKFDYVLLDMSLPVSDLAHSPVGMEWLTFGGQLILRECARRNIQSKFIVVSQFNTFIRDNEEVSFAQLKEEIFNQYPNLVIGCVRLDRGADNWKEEILHFLNQ